jgi:hypothetical protein
MADFAVRVKAAVALPEFAAATRNVVDPHDVSTGDDKVPSVKVGVVRLIVSSM